MIFLIGLGVAAGIGLILWGALTVKQVDATLTARLNRFNLKMAGSLTELELQIPRSERLLGPMRRTIAFNVRRFTPDGAAEKTQAKLAMAGNPDNLTVQEFLGRKGMTGIGIGVGTFLFTTFVLRSPFLHLLLYVVVATIGGFYLPDLRIRRKIKARQKEIQKYLADAIDILAISVEAGQGFDGALETLSKRKQNSLTHEFDRFRMEVGAGKGRKEGLRDLALRTGVEDIKSFVAAMIQADQLGIGIAQVLRAQAEDLRVRRRQRAEQRAQKAPIKMLFPLIFLMFPSLFIVILGPTIPKLMQLGHT